MAQLQKGTTGLQRDISLEPVQSLFDLPQPKVEFLQRSGLAMLNILENSGTEATREKKKVNNA